MQPLLHWKSNTYYVFWVCVYRLGYPSFNERAPYCRLWPVRLCNIFPPCLINGTIFEKKKVFGVMCFFYFFLQHLSDTFLILRRNERDVHVKYPLLLSGCNENWISSKNSQISSFTKIRPMLAQFHANGQTDMSKLIVTFRKICERAFKHPIRISSCHCLRTKSVQCDMHYIGFFYMLINVHYLSKI